MRALLSTIAFEIYKNKLKDTIYDVSDYKIPNKVDKIF